jgi:NosR/NirI family transcriptional regulator, nitrous oxide reductase regulator
MMSLTWYVLGLLTVASGEGLRQVNQRYRLDWIAWCGLLSGIGALLFCIAWAVGAYLEGVPRAAAMGLLLFGLGGIVILALVSKYINARVEKREVKVSVSPAAVAMADKATRTVPVQRIISAPISATEKQIWTILGRLAYLSLIIALFLGLMSDGKDYESMLHLKFPEVKLTKLRENPTVFRIGAEDSGNYALIQEGQGYGGPFVIGLRIMEDARVHGVALFDNKETPAFLDKIEKANFAAQYVGKHVSDDFLVGEDVDVVSGATVSTRAATMAVRNGAHIAATEYFKLKPTWKQVPWNLGLGEILIILMFGLAFVPKIHQTTPWKYLYMAASLVIVGFYMNASISISSLSGLALGFIPPLKEHIVWWVLVMGSVLAVVLLGKNVYCYRICPFFWVEWILHKIGASQIKLSPGLQQRSRYVANFCLWAALMVIFLSSHPGLGNYEPFAMMFSLDGVGVQWYLFPLALVGSFFLSNFWCRFFCPVGYSFTHLLSWRRRLLEKFSAKEKTTEA